MPDPVPSPTLLTRDFDFALPDALVAQTPARPRESARLLEVSPHGLSDTVVRDLSGLLRPGDLLVANDTAVIPAQLAARRAPSLGAAAVMGGLAIPGARIGITLDRILPDGSWHALLRNARRTQAGEDLHFEASPGSAPVTARIVSRDDEGGAVLRFSVAGQAFDRFLRETGALALPPYIERPAGPTEADRQDYQTVFARHDGAVAAPTAGLHFTPALLHALAAAGIARTTVTLHVGAGTFLPMRGDDVASHTMHPERGIVSAEAADAINRTRAAGGRIVAVGTTSLRLLESAVDETGRVRPMAAETRLFIRPGHRFRTADLLLTNFHLPRSTLFMLVCAFAGHDRMREAYAHAVREKYRFYSYGDACLLHRDPAADA
ncbi:tRNA preQ1(34) S-adenosylmethionine ribosyltransferase-isomerase QueA [Lichenicoccus sp.]|uniref:tRNA preQ1(34) S-adenosylmethionine ribosyltransferase-isomerase QueA n=1 Tax=Lichenicoccus sp. TaxID=2781899 RepID=UPI003D09C1D3